MPFMSGIAQSVIRTGKWPARSSSQALAPPSTPTTSCLRALRPASTTARITGSSSTTRTLIRLEYGSSTGLGDDIGITELSCHRRLAGDHPPRVAGDEQLLIGGDDPELDARPIGVDARLGAPDARVAR